MTTRTNETSRIYVFFAISRYFDLGQDSVPAENNLLVTVSSLGEIINKLQKNISERSFALVWTISGAPMDQLTSLLPGFISVVT